MINYTINVSDLEYFLLVLTRISMFISVAPLYGQRGIPNRVKIGFSFFVAVLIYGTIPDKTPLDYNTVWGYAAIVLREGMTGLLIGFAANMATTIVAFAGRIIDMESIRLTRARIGHKKNALTGGRDLDNRTPGDYTETRKRRCRTRSAP